mgnify:CR=1 FL=1
MKYSEAHTKLREYRQQIAGIRAQMRETVAGTEPERVQDYAFDGADGPVRLSTLFGAHDDLIVIHNMGVACPACTLWADGYNGLHQHVARRAAFAVASPDTPDVQRGFARARGWVFPMVSHARTSFATDMGYRADTGPLAAQSAFILVNSSNANRYPVRAGTDGLLTTNEVTTLATEALKVANRARAQIRRPLGSPAQVTVNGVEAEVIGAAGFPGSANGYQVNFRVPSNTASGNASLQISSAWIPGTPVRLAIQ